MTPDELAGLCGPSPWSDRALQDRLLAAQHVPEAMRDLIAEQALLRIKRGDDLPPALLEWIARDWADGRAAPKRSPTRRTRIAAEVYAFQTLFEWSQARAIRRVANINNLSEKAVESIVYR